MSTCRRPVDHHWHRERTTLLSIFYTCCNCGIGRRRWRPGCSPTWRSQGC